MTKFSERRFRQALAKVAPRVFSQECFHRNVSSKAYTEHRVAALDARHSKTVGNRYNFRGAFPVLYLAHHATLAMLEVEKRSFEILLPFDEACRIDLPVQVTGPFLDLTDEATRDQFGLTSALLTQPTKAWQAAQAAGHEAPTQTIGRLVRESGRFGGIYFPSVEAAHLEDLLPNPNNLAVFMRDRLPPAPDHPEVRLEALDPQKFLADLARRYPVKGKRRGVRP